MWRKQAWELVIRFSAHGISRMMRLHGEVERQSEQITFPEVARSEFRLPSALSKSVVRIYGVCLGALPHIHCVQATGNSNIRSGNISSVSATQTHRHWGKIRHPFAQLVSYMWAVPAIPWPTDKILYVVPCSECCRPQCCAVPSPRSAAIRKGRWRAASALLGYSPWLASQNVDSTQVPLRADQDMMTFWADLRPRTLNYWLRNLQSKAHRFEVAGPRVRISQQLNANGTTNRS